MTDKELFIKICEQFTDSVRMTVEMCGPEWTYIKLRMYPSNSYNYFRYEWRNLDEFLYGDYIFNVCRDFIKAFGEDKAADCFVPGAMQAFIEIAAVKPKTREELEFYLDLYFKEYKETA